MSALSIHYVTGLRLTPPRGPDVWVRDIIVNTRNGEIRIELFAALDEPASISTPEELAAVAAAEAADARHVYAALMHDGGTAEAIAKGTYVGPAAAAQEFLDGMAKAVPEVPF